MIEYTTDSTGTRIVLAFTYDKKIIRTVRSIPGAAWDGKHWSVPAAQSEHLRKLLGGRIAAPVQQSLLTRQQVCLYCNADCTQPYCNDEHRMRYLALTQPRLYGEIMDKRRREERSHSGKH